MLKILKDNGFKLKDNGLENSCLGGGGVLMGIYCARTGI